MRTALAPTLLTLLLATPILAATVEIETTPGDRLSASRTYAWRQEFSLPNPLNHQRVLAAVEHELARAGYVRVEGEAEADLHVAFGARARDEHQPARLEKGYGFGTFGGVGHVQVPERDVRIGTLVVQIWDAKSGDQLWKGTAEETLDVKPYKNGKKIDKAVHKLFERFPRAAK